MKNTTKTTSKNKTKRRILICAAVTLVIIATGYLIYTFYYARTVNYAKEVAKPIEIELIKSGVVKVCERGDGGHGSDNQSPWYRGYFSVPKSEKDTASLVSNSTSKYGYHLNRATKENKGPLGAVADQFVDSWYYDFTSKRSLYSDLEDGYVQLAVTINSPGSSVLCGGKTLKVDSNNSTVGLRIDLPKYRR